MIVGDPPIREPTSHTTVRTDLYTAVRPHWTRVFGFAIVIDLLFLILGIKKTADFVRTRRG